MVSSANVLLDHGFVHGGGDELELLISGEFRSVEQLYNDLHVEFYVYTKNTNDYDLSSW